MYKLRSLTKQKQDKNAETPSLVSYCLQDTRDTLVYKCNVTSEFE